MERFRHVVAGFAWPGMKPGFGIVFGVSYEDAVVHNISSFSRPVEIEERNTGEFLKDCLRLRKEYMVSFLYGDPNNSPGEPLYPINKTLRERGEAEFWITNADNLGQQGNFTHYVSLIRDYLQLGEKLLFPGDCTGLQGYVNNSPEEAAVKGSAEEYPPAAAFGYAIASVRVYKSWEYYSENVKEEEAIWDPWETEWR